MTRIDVGSVVARAFDLYRENVGVLLPLALAIFLVEGVLAFWGGVLALVGAVLAVILGVFYQGMVVQLVRDVQDGRRDNTVGELVSSVSPVAGKLFLVAIVAGIGIAIGFILLIVPGLILLTLWAVIAPVVVLERPGVFETFGRSRDLVRGNGWSVFGVLVVVYALIVVASVVAAVVGAPLGEVGRAVVQWLLGGLVAPVSALVASVLYFALREAHGEGTIRDETVAPDGTYGGFAPPHAGA
jgi:hypothetical protein